jgi:hypothetical protein
MREVNCRSARSTLTRFAIAGVSHVESAGQGRVQGLFSPGSRPGLAPGNEGPRPPAAPFKLN